MGIFDLFKKKLSPSVVQTGLIFKAPTLSDAISGINPRLSGKPINPDAIWGPYFPSNEKQSIPFTFDTNSCVSFSVTNTIETILNFLISKDLLSKIQLNFLKNNGYFDKNGSVNFSDRFLAITSNTTKYGNDYVTVLTTARNKGLIPESDLPFNGNSFEEYNDKSVITKDMLDKAERFKNIFEILFEWAFISEQKKLSTGIKNTIDKSLTECPLAVGIAYPAYHAIMLTDISSTKARLFDSYDPFQYDYKLSEGIHFGFKIAVEPRSNREYPDYQFRVKSIAYGSSGVNVTALQQVLCVDGFIHEKYITGNFLSLTKSALQQWQRVYGLLADGVCGPKTIKKLNELCKKKV